MHSKHIMLIISYFARNEFADTGNLITVGTCNLHAKNIFRRVATKQRPFGLLSLYIYISNFVCRSVHAHFTINIRRHCTKVNRQKYDLLQSPFHCIFRLRMIMKSKYIFMYFEVYLLLDRIQQIISI